MVNRKIIHLELTERVDSFDEAKSEFFLEVLCSSSTEHSNEFYTITSSGTISIEGFSKV